MSIISFMKKLSVKDWIIILSLICIGYLFISRSYYKNKYEYDIVVYNDSIFDYKNKYDQIYKANNLYVQDINNLKKQNNDLSNEVKSLKDNPIVITKVITETKIDSIVLKDTVKIYNDSICIDWWYNYNYSKYNTFSINGTTCYNNLTNKSNTILNNLSFNADLYLDIVEKNDQLLILTKSNNPYLNFSNIEGAVISPSNSKVLKKYFKQKKWNIGIYGGYGITFNNGSLLYGPQLGIGIEYSLFSF